jgi:hypothetical protein
MMPLDLPAAQADIDRFIPQVGHGKPWVERARRNYSFDMMSALKGALKNSNLTPPRLPSTTGASAFASAWMG